MTGSPCMSKPLATTLAGPLGRVGQAGERQAALLAVLLLVGEVEGRVDQVPEHVVDVVGEDPQPDADLRRGQADAGRVEHRLGEVLDERAQLLVEVDDRLGRRAQHRVAEEPDGLDGHGLSSWSTRVAGHSTNLAAAVRAVRPAPARREGFRAAGVHGAMTLMTDIDIMTHASSSTPSSTPRPSRRTSPALAERTRAETDAPGMMVGTLEGRFLAALVAMHARSVVLEIGTFTGYSRAVDGRGVAPGWADHHVRHQREARGDGPAEHRATARTPTGSRSRSGRRWSRSPHLDGPFDLVFIDADKVELPRLLRGAAAQARADDGVILVDNVLWSGRLVDDPTTRRATPRRCGSSTTTCVADERVEVVMLTVRDGVSLIRHRRAGPAG